MRQVQYYPGSVELAQPFDKLRSDRFTPSHGEYVTSMAASFGRLYIAGPYDRVGKLGTETANIQQLKPIVFKLNSNLIFLYSTCSGAGPLCEASHYRMESSHNYIHS